VVYFSISNARQRYTDCDSSYVGIISDGAGVGRRWALPTATPGRIWLAAVNNGGVVSLAVINCLSVTGSPPTALSIFHWPPGHRHYYGIWRGCQQRASALQRGGPAGVAYSVLGFVTYEAGSTLATAGTWSA